MIPEADAEKAAVRAWASGKRWTHTCPSCGLFGRKVRRRERQARCTAEAGLVAWFAALRAGGAS